MINESERFILLSNPKNNDRFWELKYLLKNAGIDYTVRGHIENSLFNAGLSEFKAKFHSEIYVRKEDFDKAKKVCGL